MPVRPELSPCMLASVLCLAACDVESVFPPPLTDFELRALEAYESYCYGTDAELGAIEALARSVALPELPEELMDIVIGPDSKTGAGYMLWNEPEPGQRILIAFSTPDACSIYVEGLGQTRRFISQIEKDYELAIIDSNRVGLQVTNLYVPGAKIASQESARVNGVVSTTRAKDHVRFSAVTISFVPARTVRENW